MILDANDAGDEDGTCESLNASLAWLRSER